MFLMSQVNKYNFGNLFKLIFEIPIPLIIYIGSIFLNLTVHIEKKFEN